MRKAKARCGAGEARAGLVQMGINLVFPSLTNFPVDFNTFM